MAGVTALFFLLLALAPAAFATDYTVGDSNGWSTGEDYGTWASDKTFKAGDNLVFSYSPMHSVDVVNEADYSSCSTGNSIKSYSGGSTTIPLNKAGKYYFICGAMGHCTQGMKLAVTVAASDTPSTPSTPTTPSTPSTTPTTPAGGSTETSTTPTTTTYTPTTTTSTEYGAAAGKGLSAAVLVGGLIAGLGLIG